MQVHSNDGRAMRDEDAVLAELDRLLNDPDVAMHAGRVWALADQVARQAADRRD